MLPSAAEPYLPAEGTENLESLAFDLAREVPIDVVERWFPRLYHAV